jgi:hypothetical protein
MKIKRYHGLEFGQGHEGDRLRCPNHWRVWPRNLSNFPLSKAKMAVKRGQLSQGSWCRWSSIFAIYHHGHTQGKDYNQASKCTFIKVFLPQMQKEVFHELRKFILSSGIFKQPSHLPNSSNSLLPLQFLWYSGVLASVMSSLCRWLLATSTVGSGTKTSSGTSAPGIISTVSLA